MLTMTGKNRMEGCVSFIHPHRRNVCPRKNVTYDRVTYIRVKYEEGNMNKHSRD